MLFPRDLQGFSVSTAGKPWICSDMETLTTELCDCSARSMSVSLTGEAREVGFA